LHFSVIFFFIDKILLINSINVLLKYMFYMVFKWSYSFFLIFLYLLITRKSDSTSFLKIIVNVSSDKLINLTSFCGDFKSCIEMHPSFTFFLHFAICTGNVVVSKCPSFIMRVVVLFLDAEDLPIKLNRLLSIIFFNVESIVIQHYNFLFEKRFLLGVVKV
jgi:hypothetical protein